MTYVAIVGRVLCIQDLLILKPCIQEGTIKCFPACQVSTGQVLDANNLLLLHDMFVLVNIVRMNIS